DLLVLGYGHVDRGPSTPDPQPGPFGSEIGDDGCEQQDETGTHDDGARLDFSGHCYLPDSSLRNPTYIRSLRERKDEERISSNYRSSDERSSPPADVNERTRSSIWWMLRSRRRRVGSDGRSPLPPATVGFG